MTVLLVCLSLQLCDLATTLLFMRHGVAEANPAGGGFDSCLRPTRDGAGAGDKAAGCGLGGVCVEKPANATLAARQSFLRRYVSCWNLLAIARSEAPMEAAGGAQPCLEALPGQAEQL